MNEGLLTELQLMVLGVFSRNQEARGDMMKKFSELKVALASGQVFSAMELLQEFKLIIKGAFV